MMRRNLAPVHVACDVPVRVESTTRADLLRVYKMLGWRTEESVVPGRHRIFDKHGLIEVVTEEEAWQLLEDHRFVIRLDSAAALRRSS
jgi:hypothetical protein